MRHYLQFFIGNQLNETLTFISSKLIMTPHKQPPVVFRKPCLQDGQAIYDVVKSCPPLDLNSRYLYFLQADHFADTCVLAELDNHIVGFISGYIRPNNPNALFVWQVAVAPSMRCQNLAKRLLTTLIENQNKRTRVDTLSTTISPSNTASQKLFTSFANSHGLEIHQQNYLAADHFGEDGHEAEHLYTFTAPLNQFLLDPAN